MNVIIILSIFTCARLTCAKVIFNGQTYNSGQITSRGYNDPGFDYITGLLAIESEYNNECTDVVLLAIGSDDTYSDDIIMRHISKGCLGTIIVGVSEVYPGDPVNNMRNDQVFSYPVVGITYIDFEYILANLSSTNNYTVQISGEPGDNVWKTLGLTSIILTMIIMNGILCLFFIIWNAKTLQLIFVADNYHKAKLTTSTTIINIVHNIVRIIGLINYNGFYQLYNTTAASIISGLAAPILFVSCWINALMMHQIVNSNSLKIDNFLNHKVIWPFILCSSIVVVSDSLLNGLYSVRFTDSLSPLYISIVRIAIMCILTLILSIVYTVGSAYILKSLKASPIPSKRRTILVRKSAITLFVMSGLLFTYCIGVAFAFVVFQDPYSTISIYLFLNIIISCISGILSFNNYFVIRGRIYYSSTSKTQSHNRISSAINQA